MTDGERRAAAKVGATVDPGFDDFRADLAGVVDVLAGYADQSCTSLIIPVWNNFRPTYRFDLPPLLRPVVLVGQPALGLRLDLKRVGLGVGDFRGRPSVTRPLCRRTASST